MSANPAGGTHKCAMKACAGGQPAVWAPVLTFYAKRGTTGASAILGFRVCDNCRDGSTLADFLSDTGYSQLAEGFVRLGRQHPKRELTELSWKFLESGESPFSGTPFDGKESA